MYGKKLLPRSTHNIGPPYTHHEYQAHKESVWKSLEKDIQRTRTYQNQIHVKSLTEKFQYLSISFYIINMFNMFNTFSMFHFDIKEEMKLIVSIIQYLHLWK